MILVNMRFLSDKSGIWIPWLIFECFKLYICLTKIVWKIAIIKITYLFCITKSVTFLYLISGQQCSVAPSRWRQKVLLWYRPCWVLIRWRDAKCFEAKISVCWRWTRIKAKVSMLIDSILSYLPLMIFLMK